MDPVREFVPTLKYSIRIRDPRTEGILLTNLLFDRDKLVNDDKTPTEDGIDPSIKFVLASKKTSLLSNPTVDGMLPVKELDDKRSSDIPDK